MNRLHASALRQLQEQDTPTFYIRHRPVELNPDHPAIFAQSTDPNGVMNLIEHFYLMDPSAPTCQAVALEYDPETLQGTVYYYSYQELDYAMPTLTPRPLVRLFEDETSEAPPVWMNLPEIPDEFQEDMQDMSEE